MGSQDLFFVRVQRSLFFPLIKPPVLLGYGLTLMTLFNLICILKALSSDIVTLWVRVSTCECEGGGRGVRISAWQLVRHD